MAFGVVLAGAVVAGTVGGLGSFGAAEAAVPQLQQTEAEDLDGGTWCTEYWKWDVERQIFVAQIHCTDGDTYTQVFFGGN